MNLPNKIPRFKNTPPDMQYEGQYTGLVCGVDEAGRGPLAGPVVAAAVILRPDIYPAGLNDSKKLTHRKREALFAQLINCAQIGVGIAEPEEIDRINILAASLIAMRRAVEALPLIPDAALIDGNRDPGLSCVTETIVKGDAKSLSIAAASIVAKVTRDRIMAEADIRFPGYGFAGHKGYPTAAHRAAVAHIGPCAVHRISFAPVKAFLLTR